MIVLLLYVYLFGGILLALLFLITDCCGFLPYTMLAFMWLGIGVFGTGGADTLEYPLMAMSNFHIERSHYFVDFAIKY